jgi:hypothetical protein
LNEQQSLKHRQAATRMQQGSGIKMETIILWREREIQYCLAVVDIGMVMTMDDTMVQDNGKWRLVRISASWPL